MLASDGPADQSLRAFFSAHPALGQRDRGQIADTAFDVLRNRRLYAHLAQGGSGSLARRLMLISRRRRGADPDPRPVPGSEAETPQERDWLDRLATIDVGSLSNEIRLSLPDWLWQRLVAERGEADAQALAGALLQPAPLDLRVNALKSDVDAALRSLAGDGIEALPIQGLPGALTVKGKPALQRSQAFIEGWVEVQDRGSQLLSALAGARRGQTVVDFCAGAGGKTLAMAAAMRSTGQIYACDVSPARLHRLRPRLARAGATNVHPMAIDSEIDPRLARLEGRVDVVLVDAPCSGSGTLRRNPELKWRLGPADVDRLGERQSAILAAAARLVRPGGWLIYGTCSLLAQENDGVAERFEREHPDWRPEPAAAVLLRQGVELYDKLDDPRLRLRPDRDGSDGFFAARWVRPGAAR